MESVNDLMQGEALRHQVALQKYSNATVARLISMLNRSDKRLFAELTERLQHMDPASFSIERLESMLTSARSLSTQAYGEIDRELTATLKEFVGYEVAYQNQMLSSMVPVQISVAAVNAEAVAAAAFARPFQGVMLREVWKDLDAGKMKTIRQAIAQGFVESKTTDQIIRELRGTRALGYADGVLSVTRRDAEAVVRTALGHVAGFAQDRVVEANADLVNAVKWSSTLDIRTSSQCFPPSVFALPVGNLRGVFRRPWDGYLTVITTASGQKLKATPNHPVLTARGWRPINELRPGEDILYRVIGDVGSINAAEDIGMPATIGAISDALGKPAVSDVSVESSTETDFHGDGMVGQYEINQPRSEGNLRLALNAVFGEQVTEKLLTFVAVSGRLPSECRHPPVGVGSGFVDVPAQVDSSSIQDGIEAGLADVADSANFNGLDAAVEHCDDFSFISSALCVAPAERGHNAGALEYSGDGSGSDAIVTSNGNSRFASSISADDVVSVEGEFFSGHVYNLSTSTAFYIANGFVVHNCRIRDGLLYTPEKHKPIGHAVPWLQGPGRLHWRCRSHQTTVLKSNAELGINVPEVVMKDGTRASMDGQVSKDVAYGDWLAKQSAVRQDEVLGPTRAKLMRDGKLPLEAMYSTKGQYLTIEDLKAKDAQAFKRAGL